MAQKTQLTWQQAIDFQETGRKFPCFVIEALYIISVAAFSIHFKSCNRLCNGAVNFNGASIRNALN